MRNPSVLALVLLAGPAATSAPPACRCAQLPIETYFENAAIVLVARADAVTRIRPPAGAERLEVRFTPVFRNGAFKGSMDGVRFVTPVGTASCGVDVQRGETYIVFASGGDPQDPAFVWFTTCDGSRRYIGAPRDYEQEPFIGLPNHRILPRLFELADGTPSPLEPPADFHTSPACWEGLRIAHQGSPPATLRERVRVASIPGPAPDTGGVTSPNGAYRFWTGYRPEGEVLGDAGGFVVVAVERPSLLRIAAIDSRAPPQPTWVNEKLLFIRFVWSRVQFTDLLVDVERGLPIYEEAARYSQEAFEKYREACSGQCPCFVVPGRTAELPAPPVSRPSEGQEAGLHDLTRSLAFLDADWDGRVFTEPGGTAYTVSALKGELGR